METKVGHTPLPWFGDDSHSVTGPTCPSCTGVTVTEYLEGRRAENSPDPDDDGAITRKLITAEDGSHSWNAHRVVAIFPGEMGDAEANRAFVMDAISKSLLFDDLLAACEAALTADPYGGDHDLWMPKVEAAIQKAKG